MKKGILVAADERVEWLLPWWWKCYSLYNNFPVAFVDLGMSAKMRKWCKNRGMLIFLNSPKDFISKKSTLPKKITQKWEKRYRNNVWRSRQSWFKKPLACLQTPFELTLWLDVDCEVLGSLNRLFDEWVEDIELAIVLEIGLKDRVEYNSGVFLFAKEAPFLQNWAELCLTQNHAYMGDQNALTELILKGKIRCKELHPVYNWLMYQGYNCGALIAHWCSRLKEFIRKKGGLHGFFAEMSLPGDKKT